MKFVRSTIALVLVTLPALASAAMAAQDCTTAPYTLPAEDVAQSMGIHSYRVYEGEVVGNETVDTIDLLDESGQFIGQVMGGVFRNKVGLQGYVFTSIDLVTEPMLLTLAGGEYVYMYSEQTYVGQLKSSGTTGPMEVTQDLGLKNVAHSIAVQAAVLADSGLRGALGDSPASQLGGANGDAVAADPCPIWVVTTACATCVACAWVGELPPPCWGACITCGTCIGLVIPMPTPKPTPVPPFPPDRPLPDVKITFAADTIVHTPTGQVQLHELSIGDKVLSLDLNGAPTVATVIKRDLHEAYVGSVIYVNNDAIQATRGHMMLGSNGWIPAEKIAHGLIKSVSDGFVAVDSFDACELGLPHETIEVCQILVEGGTGYFVGTTGLYAESH